MIPAPVMHVLATMALLCSLSLTPVLPPWEPEAADVALVSRTIWGEARGCEPEEQEAVAWCILNRVDDERFPGTVEGVVTAKNQFSGFSWNFPADIFEDVAKDVLIRWHNGEHGIPTDLVYFRADGKGHNTFYSECFGGHEYTWLDMKGENQDD